MAITSEKLENKGMKGASATKSDGNPAQPSKPATGKGKRK